MLTESISTYSSGPWRPRAGRTEQHGRRPRAPEDRGVRPEGHAGRRVVETLAAGASAATLRRADGRRRSRAADASTAGARRRRSRRPPAQAPTAPAEPRSARRPRARPSACGARHRARTGRDRRSGPARHEWSTRAETLVPSRGWVRPDPRAPPRRLPAGRERAPCARMASRPLVRAGCRGRRARASRSPPTRTPCVPWRPADS